ncbi:MAG TPA: tyrosine-protein phosphatase [Candidatus Binataceae bacterium]|nr:tyrosine-protein phosphatase [Candidatus Binataceae bacterium]
MSADAEKKSAANRDNPPSSRRVVVDFNLLRRFGGRNFRDLGGHPAADGRRVRRARVYRSAHLSELPNETPIKSAGLRTVVTLQSRTEISILGPPHADLLRSVRWEHIPIGDRWFQEREPISLVPGREHHAIVDKFRDDWRTFFKILAERDVYPLLFHCSAGRDRTGVGAAMLLELLGVARGRIVTDFLESNLVFPKIPLAPTQLDPVFELIDEAGGIEPFMCEGIGLDRFDLEAIRADLLEDASAGDERDSNGE